MTKESAELAAKSGLRTSSGTGLSTGVIKGSSGQIKGFVEFSKGPTSVLSNPAVLAGAAGLMAQLAMQQTMDEITDYLAVIDEKVDAVLRAQQDAAVSEMAGADFVIEEAMTIRDGVGRVNEVTWSKVQAAGMPIARTQAYALMQLDSLAEAMERKAKMGDLAQVAEEAAAKVREWLAILARCFQLQDAVAILELDRVLETSPHELDDHRLALRTARENRRATIVRSTERLVGRMDEAAARANAKVLTNPGSSGTVVRSSNSVAGSVAEFHQRLGIEGQRQDLDARRWRDAAGEARDRALATGASGVDVARQRGSEGLGRAKAASGRLTGGIAGRVPRRQRPDEADESADD